MIYDEKKRRYKTIIDRELLMRFNAEGCAACRRKFNLGDPVVLACGGWGSSMKLIHENEADYDLQAERYVDRRCHSANRM